MLKIRKDNQFTWAWAITRDGQAIDLTTATNLKYKYQIKDQSGRVDILSYTKTGNIISTVFLPTQPGIYNLLLTFDLPADGPCAVDVDAFEIVKSSEEASDASEFTVTSEMAIGFTGKNAYQVWLDTHEGTLAEYEAWLKQPAADAASSVALIEEAIEQNEVIRLQSEINRGIAEGLRAESEQDRISAEGLRLIAEYDRADAESIRAGSETARDTAEGQRVQAELNRQTNTSTAISNAEIATDDANNAANLANEKAGLADQKATLADQKAGLAATAATQANTARDGANSAAQSATNLVNSYATDLAAKELKANKQNSLAADGTGTKFPTVDAVNAGLAGNTNLLSTYVHSGNKEVYVTSIDYATNTFFKTNHGLVNGNIIAVKILDYNAIEAILPIKNNTSGNVSGYRVVNASADTFQISLTDGGAAIMLVNKAGIDLTKWRFEVVPTFMDLGFTNVNNGNCTIEIYGDLSRVPRYPLGGIYTGYSSSGTSLLAIPHDIGNVFMCLYTITYRNNNGIITVNRKWNGIQLNSADATKITFVSGEIFQIPKRDSYSNINNISLMTAHITNGTVIKVWKL